MIPFKRCTLLLSALLLWTSGCKGNIVQRSPDTHFNPDYRVIWREGSVVPLPDSSPRRYDLTVTSGEACTFGQCGEGLICMANICRKKCNGFCGEKVPECADTDPCLWASDFTGACFRGTLQLGEDCSSGFCQAGTLCVRISNQNRCYPLCGPNDSCPAGYRRCSLTDPLQCKICTP